jgi:hypothetical protein
MLRKMLGAWPDGGFSQIGYVSSSQGEGQGNSYRQERCSRVAFDFAACLTFERKPGIQLQTVRLQYAFSGCRKKPQTVKCKGLRYMVW